MEHGHKSEPGQHPKQGFQVERLAFFSDAVFAIAITLLVIEFKVPHVTKESTYQDVLTQLADMKASLVSVLLSFGLIASYWMRHYFLYKYIHNYNTQIVIVNMLSLLPIIFLPFTTDFFAECAINDQTIVLGMQVFFINHFAAGITIYGLYWLGMVRHKDLSYDIPLDEKLKFYEQTLFSSVIFLSLFVTTLFTRNVNNVIAVLVVGVVVREVIIRLLKRKARKQVKGSMSK